MKPLNQPERRSRLWQFTLLYLLALLVPLVASYYLFSNKSIADENARLKHELDVTHEEQARLITRFDTLTQYLQHIADIDQRIKGEPNQLVVSSLTIKNQDYMNAIAVGLSELRNDSTKMQVPAHRMLARNILRDFTLYRMDRNTIDVLRQEMLRQGDEAKGCERISQQLDQAKQQVIMLQASLNRPQAGGGAAPVAQPQTPSTSSRLQVALLKNQVAFAEADCLRQRALDKKARSKERLQLLQQSRTAYLVILQNPATADMKQSVEKTLEGVNVELGQPPRFFGLIN